MPGLGSTDRRTLTVGIGPKQTAVQMRANLFRSDLGVITGPAEFQGMLLVPRWEELLRLIADQTMRRFYRFRPEDLRYQAVASLYHAIRQVEHIMAGYGLTFAHGEKALMLRARAAALDANQIALGLAKGTVDRTAEELRAVTGEIMIELGRPRDLPLREGQRYLAELASGRDKSGRANETVTMVRAIAASERFRERLEDGIMRIEPVVVMRQKVLLNLHELACFSIGVALDFVSGLVRELDTHRTRFYSDHLNVARSQNRLRHFATELRRIDFHPYLVPLTLVVQELRASAYDLPTRPAQAVQTLLRARESLRLCQFQVELQRFILILTRVTLNTRPMVLFKALERILSLERTLRDISDNSFQYPVRFDLFKLLSEARALLIAPTAATCTTAREVLKQAADLLGRPPAK